MNPVLVTDVLPVFPDHVGKRGYVVIRDGRFSEIGTGKPSMTGYDTVIDGAGAMMMPGLIDTHVHFREPGMTAKGTVASESAAALRGGVTMVFDMPNTVPPTTTVEAYNAKVELFKRDCLTDFRIFLGAAPGIMDVLPKIDRSYLAGVKLFWGATTGSTGMPGADELNRLFEYCAKEGIVVMVHAEDNEIIADNTAEAIARYGSKKAVPVEEHARIRSSRACYEASKQAIELAQRHGTRLHLAHVSTIEELALLKHGKIGEKLITAETTPLYTNNFFAKPENFSNRLKVNPAVKGGRVATALQDALCNDLIDTLGTDHAPHRLSDKEGGALTAASGAPWIQFALPLLLETFAPQVIARKMAQAPAALFGLAERGEIRPGYIADFSLVASVDPYKVNDSDVVSICGWTPLASTTLTHRILLTHRANHS